VFVVGKGGSDVDTVDFGTSLTTPLTISGSGTDTLVANGSSGDNNFVKTTGSTSTIRWGPQVGASAVQPLETVSYAGVANLFINGGDGKSQIVDPGSNTTINGGFLDNTIVITATTGSGVAITGGGGNNTYIVDLGSLAGPVTISNSNLTASDSLIVTGAPGNNAITVSGNQITAGGQTITVTAPLVNLTLNGGSGNNQFTVSRLTLSVQNLALNGGGGTNTFALNNVGSSVGDVTIGAGSGGPGSNLVQIQGSLPPTFNPLPFVGTVSGPGSAIPGQPVAFAVPFSVAGPPSTETAVWSWGDGTTTTLTTSTASGTLSASHVYAASRPVPYGGTLTLTNNQDGLVAETSFSVAVTRSIDVLDPTAVGAVSVSGNASVTIPGSLVVDSSSASALSESGNAQVTAATIQVVGNVKKSGNATLAGMLTTGASAVADPMAGLLGPSTAGLTNYGSANYSGNGSYTLKPGIYSQINASGNVKLTLNPGLYLIEGGGFTVTGNASVSGTGVTLYNTGSNYPNAGGSFGGITLSGNGTFTLSAAGSTANGAYPGVVIYQARANTRALSFSGNALGGITGTVYAANASVVLSGNGQLQGAVVAGTLNLTGNGGLTQTAAGSDGSGDTAGVADTLVAGNLYVYINDPAGYFTADDLARIQDAITGWDALLVPYNVTISEVSDPSLANLVVDTGTTSACGGIADGVLGCFNNGAGEVTLIQGWDWYAGADPSQIGPGQYDFETTVAHELGHALGLGGSDAATSPMNETLPAGIARRTMTVPDLNIPYPPEGADPLTAAGFRSVGDDGPHGQTASASAATAATATAGNPAFRMGSSLWSAGNNTAFKLALPKPGVDAAGAAALGNQVTLLVSPEGAVAPLGMAIAGAPNAAVFDMVFGNPRGISGFGNDISAVLSPDYSEPALRTNPAGFWRSAAAPGDQPVPRVMRDFGVASGPTVAPDASPEVAATGSGEGYLLAGVLSEPRAGAEALLFALASASAFQPPAEPERRNRERGLRR
jgi:hypothetical protein